MTAKCSIIVPIFNSNTFLRECLDSIVNQSYQELEIILVDDGSTDDSGDICDEYATGDERIEVVHVTNGGVAKAVKRGIGMASGEYIAFVDSDDKIDLAMIDKMVAKAQNSAADLVMCNYYAVTEQSQTIKMSMTDKVLTRATMGESLSNIMFEDHEQFAEPCRWNKLYKRCLLQQVLPIMSDGLTMAEDLEMNIFYFDLCDTIELISEPLYYYRYLPTSLSNKKSSRWKNIILLYESIHKWAGNKVDINNHLQYTLVNGVRGEVALFGDEKNERKRLKTILSDSRVQNALKHVITQSRGKEKIWLVLMQKRAINFIRWYIRLRRNDSGIKR